MSKINCPQLKSEILPRLRSVDHEPRLFAHVSLPLLILRTAGRMIPAKH